MSDVGLYGKYKTCDDVWKASDLRFERWIGSGSSCSVALVCHSEDRMKKMAMKVFDNEIREESEQNAHVMDAMFLREISVIQNIKHKHILSDVKVRVLFL